MSQNKSLHIIKVIFSITFSQTIRSKKTVFMSILTFLPVLLAIYYRFSGRQTLISPEQALSQIMMFYMLFLSVLVALFYGTSLVADEVDNRTIIYLFTRPIRKYLIIFGKLAAYVLGVFLILIPPMVLTFLIIATDSHASSDFSTGLSLFGKRLGVAVLSLIVYGSIFLFLGVWRRHPVIIGLLFAFGWEKVIVIVPGIVRKLSVVHYLLSALPGEPINKGFTAMMPPGLSITTSPVDLSIIVLLAITVVFLGLSIFTIYRKEYRLE